MAIMGATLYRSSYGIYPSGFTSGQLTIVGNTIVNNTNDGIATIGTGTGISAIVHGNIITDNGGYGINFAAHPHMTLYNRLRGNTSGSIFATNADWGTYSQYGNITTGSSTDYVNAASDDYRLLTTSPAYQAGIPAYRSMGASEPLAAAGGLILAPGFEGGFIG
jgi:hypothetical protein